MLNAGKHDPFFLNSGTSFLYSGLAGVGECFFTPAQANVWGGSARVLKVG